MIIGLTGHIAAGKSEAAAFMVRAYKCFLFDADKETTYLRGEPGIQTAILKTFPRAKDENGVLCRHRLRGIVFSDSGALRTLEDILYPALRTEAADFVELMRKRQSHGVIDAPLLYRAGLEFYCDHVILIRTDTDTRRARYQRRPGVRASDFDRIDASQHDIDTQAGRADIIIDGGLPLEDMQADIQRFIAPIIA